MSVRCARASRPDPSCCASSRLASACGAMRRRSGSGTEVVVRTVVLGAGILAFAVFLYFAVRGGTGVRVEDASEPLVADRANSAPSDAEHLADRPADQGTAGVGGHPGVGRLKLREGVTLPEWMKKVSPASGAPTLASPSGHAQDVPPRSLTHATRSPLLSGAEASMLDLYVGVVKVLEDDSLSCADRAAAIEAHAATNEPIARALAQERAALPDEAARIAAQEDMETEAGEELEELRQSIRLGVARCAEEPRLFDAIRVLAATGRTP